MSRFLTRNPLCQASRPMTIGGLIGLLVERVRESD